MATSKSASRRMQVRRPLAITETSPAAPAPTASTSIEDMLLAAQSSGSDSMETGRYIVTFKEGAITEGIKALKSRSMRMADARDFEGQSLQMEALGDADAVVFPEIGAALIGAPAALAHGLEAMSEPGADDPMQIVEPEYFVFPAGSEDYLRGFLRAAETIARDLSTGDVPSPGAPGEQAEVAGNTWGLNACRVPASTRNGTGIKVAVLDTGFAIGHPDFVGRALVTNTFVGQPVQDLHGHGTHCIGTALGPQAPSGTTPRYGIAFRGTIYVGKVLSNSGGSVGGSVLAGMNWAIANGCEVISMSLGGQGPVQAAYTAAGQAALNRGLLIIAAAGNAGGPTGYPANSPTIMSVASLDPNLQPSSFSNFGKIDIAAPGRDIFSAAPMPRRYATMSGTSMATPHVSGCAALWAQTHPGLRGVALWNRLRDTARKLPLFPPSRIGAGLVQAP
ncbi:S8 family serine peptidase [Roseateles chitinivorans]|uniref:S8 family serine peptidase n=1 Tax=Roseateles chitinivorans TaxID=2917965 RepID=UPI003D67286A